MPRRLPNTILLRGRPHAVKRAEGRGTVRCEEDVLYVHGEPTFLARRLTDWLMAEARREIEPRANAHAQRLGKKIRRITLKDTRSRWGSCGEDGVLMFCWRLILAPPEVLDYVVCHEVAHLVEMNHSARFWRVVQDLCPHHDRARRWLQTHGESLYKVR